MQSLGWFDSYPVALLTRKKLQTNTIDGKLMSKVDTWSLEYISTKPAYRNAHNSCESQLSLFLLSWDTQTLKKETLQEPWRKLQIEIDIGHV